MRLVVDAIGVRPGSAAIVIEGLLRGWEQVAPEDELVVLTDGQPAFDVPAIAAVQRLVDGRAGLRARLAAQTTGVRLACRRLGADALLSSVTAGAFLGAACPRGAIVYDVRHELRPEQFSFGRRLIRRVAYGWTFRRANALFCISERTRQDVLATRPWLAAKTHATLLGADHAADWRPAGTPAGTRYVLAFGHFPNKNLAGVLHAWQVFAPHVDLRLRVCGLPRDARAWAERTVAELGLGETVELLGWLDDGQFRSVFAGAAAVLFPSDFEGFGLPVVEAMLLGIPVVVSTDRALLEVSGGHAVVATDERPETVAAAIDSALNRPPGAVEAAMAHARTFTWARMARQVRDILSRPVGVRVTSARR
jgi:glycosyltransferase involved in cell wall biosynthesis